jgi:hypothetical protein
MEEYDNYTKTQDNVVDGSLIAISVIILAVWFTTGTPDISSEISFYALVVSLPLLATDLLLRQMPHIQYRNKAYRYLSNLFSEYLSTRIAFIGIIFAIGHVSGIAAILLMFISIICYFIFVDTLSNTKKSLEKENQKLFEQTLQATMPDGSIHP